MPVYVSFKEGGGPVLPAGEHAAKIISADLVPNNLEPSKGDQVRIIFESLKWKSPSGEPGQITVYSSQSYGSPKSNLTKLINAVVGRALTARDFEPVGDTFVKQLDLEKLVGVAGYVMVVPHTKNDGSPTVKWAAFRIPENRPFIDVATLLVDAPSPDQINNGSGKQAEVPAPVTSTDDDIITDPFAE